MCRCDGFSFVSDLLLHKSAPPFSAILTDPRWQLQFRQRVLTLCRTLELFFYAAFNFTLTRVRGEIFFSREPARGCDAPGPHVVDEHHLQKPLRCRVGDVARWKSHGYKLPSTAVPGPRLVGVSRLLAPRRLHRLTFVRTDRCLSKFTRSTRTNGENPVCHVFLSFSWMRPHLDLSLFVV